MKIFQVDAFTDRAFSGNSAAICFPDSDINSEWMQNMAMEMNLSETAFLQPKSTAVNGLINEWGLRWFTPGREVDLCGHATLAAAHVLFDNGYAATEEQIKFHTRSGILRSNLIDGNIQLDFPSRIVTPYELPEGAAEALNVSPTFSGIFSDYILLELASAEEVENCKPDFGKLAMTFDGAFIITAPSEDDTFDFISRFFAPAYKVNEDPVTGSAHCMLGTYWGEKLGKKTMRAFQASERGGVLDLIWENDRMFLNGMAITVFVGDVLIES